MRHGSSGWQVGLLALGARPLLGMGDLQRSGQCSSVNVGSCDYLDHWSRTAQPANPVSIVGGHRGNGRSSLALRLENLRGRLRCQLQPP